MRSTCCLVTLLCGVLRLCGAHELLKAADRELEVRYRTGACLMTSQIQSGVSVVALWSSCMPLVSVHGSGERQHDVLHVWLPAACVPFQHGAQLH
jgi:hypothetical protein